MNTPNQIAPVVLAANVSPGFRNKSFAVWFTVGLLLLTLGVARAAGPDEDYLAIYGIMGQADALNTKGQTSQAHDKYVEAQQDLIQFQKDNPGWNVNIVSYRLNYLAEKITDTSPATVATVTTPAADTTSSPAVNAAIPAASTSQPAGSPATAPIAKSPVKLLDAGSEPRTVLRLHPTVGDKQSISMTMKIGMDMSVAGNTVPAMDLPAIVMNLDVAVKDISAEGTIAYTILFNAATIAADANTQPAIATAMKASLDGFSGMTGTGEMSDRGVVKNVDLKLPANAAPQLAQAIGQMKDSFSSSSTPLPEEAVGPGAKWEYKTRIKSQGMNIDQTIAFELVSVEGDHVNLRSTLTQSALNQKISNPAMPTMKMDLTKMSGNGGGTSTLDLGKLMPVSGTLAEKTEMSMSMNIGQQKQTMNMKMNINVSIEAK